MPFGAVRHLGRHLLWSSPAKPHAHPVFCAFCFVFWVSTLFLACTLSPQLHGGAIWLQGPGGPRGRVASVIFRDFAYFSVICRHHHFRAYPPLSMAFCARNRTITLCTPCLPQIRSPFRCPSLLPGAVRQGDYNWAHVPLVGIGTRVIPLWRIFLLGCRGL